MSEFTHGTYSSEKESSLQIVLAAKNPVVVIGTAPVNMGDITCVNKAQLINTVADAAKYFGGTNLVEGFTISEALYVGMNLFGVSPMICINVLDPEKHKTSYEFQEIIVVEGKATLEHTGILLDTINLKNVEDSQAITEFNGYFEADGKLTIETKDEGIKKISGTYSYLDPSKVEVSDIIGSIDPTTLKAKGMECIKEIFSNYSMIPSYVIAPGYTTNELRAILDTKGSLIDSKWKAMTIVELPEETKYGEAIKYKKENNWIDEDQIVTFGKVRMGEKYFNQSIFAAFLSASVDAGNEGVPYESPSNKNIKAEGIAYKTGEEYENISLSEMEANLLNENGICTIITRPNGTVFWGNRTSVFQPGGNTDPKDIWIPFKRMFKYIGNTIMLNNENHVDKPMTFSRASNIKMNINIWLNSLVATEKLLGASVDFLKEENSDQDLVNGKFKWHIYLGTITPGETLHFVLEYDGQYLSGYFAA